MHQREIKIKAISITLVIFSMMLIGTIAFSLVEGWSLLDSFYFVAMTATTVGYGDLTPTHALSKVITIIYAFSTVPLILYGFSLIAGMQMDKIYKKIHKIELKQQAHSAELEELKELEELTEEAVAEKI